MNDPIIVGGPEIPLPTCREEHPLRPGTMCTLLADHAGYHGSPGMIAESEIAVTWFDPGRMALTGQGRARVQRCRLSDGTETLHVVELSGPEALQLEALQKALASLHCVGFVPE